MRTYAKLYFFGLIFIVLFVFVGCATKPVLHSSLADDENYASISFRNTRRAGDANLTFVSFDGQSLPRPERRTHWDPIHFPSDRELRIVVHAAYQTASRTTLSGFGLIGAVVNTAQDIRAVTRNVDTDLVFISPPLVAGRNYLLTFTKEPGMPGRNLLTLTDIETARVVHQQEFEVVFGGDAVRQ